MNQFVTKHYSVLFIIFLAAIVGLSFGVGYQEGKRKTSPNSIVFSCPNTVLEKQVIKPEVLGVTAASSTAVTSISNTDANQSQGIYVGSKNGTKYYTPGCSGTNRIKPENYIWFQSVEDATLQGYSKGSC